MSNGTYAVSAEDLGRQVSLYEDSSSENYGYSCLLDSYAYFKSSHSQSPKSPLLIKKVVLDKTFWPTALSLTEEEKEKGPKMMEVLLEALAYSYQKRNGRKLFSALFSWGYCYLPTADAGQLNRYLSLVRDWVLTYRPLVDPLFDKPGILDPYLFIYLSFSYPQADLFLCSSIIESLFRQEGSFGSFVFLLESVISGMDKYSLTDSRKKAMNETMARAAADLFEEWRSHSKPLKNSALKLYFQREGKRWQPLERKWSKIYDICLHYQTLEEELLPPPKGQASILIF